ncbi:MAG: hypothetical protein KAH10_02200, partial [Flavobacteriales bacterium]|nr:hypothetical protein [Flavobacteriales bacterium]
MNKYNLKKIILKSLSFIIFYIIAIVAIAFYEKDISIQETLSTRWHEFVLLFFVVIGFNIFMDKKSRQINKNKFY